MGKDWKKKANLAKLSEYVTSQKDTEELIKARRFVKTVLHYRKITKLYSTFIKGPRKAITYNELDKIFCEFNMDGTVTGRLSCNSSVGRDRFKKGVSFHTLAKEYKSDAINVRSCYVSPPGWGFIAGDYSQMELRVLADLGNILGMKHAFRTGLDLHTDTAAKVYDLSYEAADDDQYRPSAKITNFLVVYGGGAVNLAASVGITLKKAQWVIRRYHEAYPEIQIFMDKVRAQLEEDLYVETPFGRRRHLPDIISADKGLRERAFRQAFNFLIQSTASDVLLCADLCILQNIEEQGFESILLANVHDSVEFISPREEITPFIEMLNKEMVLNRLVEELGYKMSVPLKVDIEVGPSFGVGKKAKFSEEGLLLNANELFDFFDFLQ